MHIAKLITSRWICSQIEKQKVETRLPSAPILANPMLAVRASFSVMMCPPKEVCLGALACKLFCNFCFVSSLVRIANVLAKASAKVLGQLIHFLKLKLRIHIREFVSKVLCLQNGQVIQVLK